MTDTEHLDVIVYDGALLAPAADLATVAARFGEYHALCALLLTADDWQVKGVPRPFLKRSGWRKLATAMGVTLELLSEHYSRDGDTGHWHARYQYRATAPNGRYADAVGACHGEERKMSHAFHDVLATAQTRAVNRACADLFGLGALSAEEFDGGQDDPPDDGAPAGQAARLPNGGRPPIAPDGPPWAGELRSFHGAIGEAAKALNRDVDYLRHEIVRRATEGRTESSNDLTVADMPRVWVLIEQARQQATREHAP